MESNRLISLFYNEVALCLKVCKHSDVVLNMIQTSLVASLSKKLNNKGFLIY